MDDKIALRIAMTLLASLAISRSCSALAAEPGLVPGDYCDARGEPRTPWTREAKARSIERMDRFLDALHVSRKIKAFHHVIAWREAFGGEASVRHSRGADHDGTPEDGLGMHGLSLRWHGSKWGDNADPAFCTPEVSTVVALEITRRAVTRYGARNLAEIQAVYSGDFDCSERPCRFTLSARRRRNICERLMDYGVDCGAEITDDDLGTKISMDDARDLALASARSYVAQWLGRGSVE